MDLEDESPKPQPSRDNKEAEDNSDSDNSEFALSSQRLAARLAFDAFSDDDF